MTTCLNFPPLPNTSSTAPDAVSRTSDHFKPTISLTRSPAGEEEAEIGVSQQEGCTHGEAPADLRWGLHGRRTSAGVQQAVSYLCASLTLEEAAETKRPVAAIADVSPPSAQSAAAAGRSPAPAGR